MSKQLVIAAAGAAVGFAIGGPQGAAYGFQIGAVLGAPTTNSSGPRLDDLAVSGTVPGPIPYFEGSCRTAGQIVWASERREIATTTSQGKGGSAESTTYTYEIDLMYMLSDCQMASLLRAWNNGKLVYNAGPDASVSSAIATLDSELWTRITFYGGASTQLPDATYEAAVGIGNAPAYRGRACVFIESLQLGGSGQIPNMSFEVLRGSTLGDVSASYSSSAYPTTVSYLEAAVYQNSSWWATSANNVSYTFYKSTQYGQHVFKRIVQPNFRAAGRAPVWVQTNGEPQLIYTASETGSSTGTRFVDVIFPETGIITTILSYIPGTASNAILQESRKVAYDEVQDVYVVGGIVQVENPVVINYNGNAFTRMPTIAGLKSLAAYDGKIYALVDNVGWKVQRWSYDGTFVDQVTDSTGSYVGSGLAPNTNWIRVDTDGQCWVFNQYRGRLFKITTYFEEVSTAVNVNTYNSNSLAGVFYCEPEFVAFGHDLVGTGPYTVEHRFRRFKAPTAVPPTLQSVVERLCARAGMVSTQYDASALSTITKPVRSMAISQTTSIRQVLDTLASVYFFGGVLSDKLYFKPRAGSSVATIPFADIGAGEGEAQSESLNLKVKNELEIPAQVSLSYANVSGDYNVSTEYSDRLLTGQTSTSAVQVPLGFTPAEAKGTADALVADAAASVLSTTISVLNEYARIEPTDVVSVVDEYSSSYRMRVTRKTEAGPVITLDLVLDDATVLASAGITSAAYTSSATVTAPADTTLQVLDIPILRDGDDPVGIYAAFAPTSTVWPGAALYKSVDGSTYAQVATVTDQTTMGTTTTALSNYARGFVFDESGTVTVIIDLGTLSSYTRDQIFNGTAPAYLIGSEIVYCKNATLIAANTYTLTGFLRGMRGTEWASSGHAAGERFVLLSTAGLRREVMDTSEIGALRYFKAPTLGRALSGVYAQTLTLAAVGKLPFSPVGLRVARATAGATISWDRRTRFAKNFTNGYVPLAEATESYQVDIWSSNTYTTLKRTLTSSTGSVLYTAADQTTDFGGLQSVVYVDVYQISAVVGRGYKLRGAA